MRELLKNPTDAALKALIAEAPDNNVKWVKDSVTGDIYCWPAIYGYHQQVIEEQNIKEYTKGYFNGASELP